MRSSRRGTSTIRTILARTAVSGTISGALMGLVIGLVSRRETGRATFGLNAISHMAWGGRAGRRRDWSLEHTGLGLALNQLACLFWSGCLEAIVDDRRPASPARSAMDAVAMAGVAYVVDYHVVPRRFTPGFELVLPRRSYPLLYAGLAVSLWAGLTARRRLCGESER